MADRVVWWVNQYAVTPTSPGGTRHFDLSAELRRRGIDVRIVASDLELHTRRYTTRRGMFDIRAIEHQHDGVPFVWLPAGSYQSNDWRRLASMMIFALAAFAFLLRSRGGRSAVVIGSSPHLFAAVAAWAAARLRRRSFVFEVRDLWPESFQAVAGREGGAAVRLMRGLADLLYRRSDAIVVLTKDNVDAVVARGARPRNVAYIPNGVDLEAFSAALPSYEEGPVRFIYLGAHGPANGLDTLIRAASLATADLEVTLLGDGPVKPALRELARELHVKNVSFVDPVPKGEVPQLLAGYHVGLMILADHDLFSAGVSPNKFFDYLAAGLLVVTNVPGFVAEVALASGVGTICEPGPTALAHAIDRTASHVRRIESWPTSGREHVANHYNRRVLADRLELILHRFGGS